MRPCLEIVSRPWIIDGNRMTKNASRNIGVLHPGAMGVSVARSLQDSGHNVGWVSARRSAETQERAQGLIAFDSLDEISVWADALISICPPHGAVALAQRVHATAFSGLYIDANALAPSTSLRIGEIMGLGAFVDGGIIGPPALQPGTTRLYLSGHHAAGVAEWFSAGALQAIPMVPAQKKAQNASRAVEQHVAASMLKMSYAAYSKGASALLLSANALAEAGGVTEALHAEWAISAPSLLKQSQRAAQMTSGKAWRFEGEMLEISETYSNAGLPDALHAGAAAVYERMAALKDLPPQELEAVVAALLKQPDD